MSGSLGNKDADKILEYLKGKESRSATKANIQQECFSNHLKKQDADRAYSNLTKNGKVEFLETASKGKTSTVVQLID